MYLSWDGTTPRARETVRRAEQDTELRLESFNYLRYHLAVLDGDYDDALEELGSAPGDVAVYQQQVFAPTDYLYARVYSLMGAEDRARDRLQTALELVLSRIADAPQDYRLHSVLGLIYAGLGEHDLAVKEAQQGVDLLPFESDAYQGSFPLSDLARVYALVGESAAAIDTLEFLLSVPSSISVPLLRIDPSWTPLRDHPRFRALLAGEP